MFLSILLLTASLSLPDALQGDWRGGCSDGKSEGISFELPVKKVRVAASFNGARTKLEYAFYTDDDCKILQAKHFWQGTYEVSADAPELLSGHLVIQYDRALLMPLSVEAIDELNLLGSYCGGAEWRVGDLRDVTACDHGKVGKVIRSGVKQLGKDRIRFKNRETIVLMERDRNSILIANGFKSN